MEKKEKKLEIDKEIAGILKNGGIGVLPTDTLYGLVGSALNKKTVEKIYELRKRELDKPMIILISDVKDILLFGIELDNKTKKQLKNFWPGMVSIIVDCNNKKFEYLHRGKKTLAFRLPDNERLQKLLKKTGPLVAPSANLAGEKAATTIKEAKKYFDFNVDFFVGWGKLKSKPSTIIKLDDHGNITLIRNGAVRI